MPNGNHVGFRAVKIEKFIPIITGYQQSGKIPTHITPERVIGALKRDVLRYVSHYDQEEQTQYTLNEIVDKGNQMLEDTKAFREQSSEDFRQRIMSTMDQARCFTISGPSGSGKQSVNTTLIEMGMPQVLLFNIRDDRGPEELWGVAYHFIREYPTMSIFDGSGQKSKTLKTERDKQRSLILGSYDAKHRFISKEGVHVSSGLISQGVPRILFELGDEHLDPFVEVDIKHAKNIIGAAKIEAEKGHNIQVFPIFVLPANFESLTWQLALRTIGENMPDSGTTWFDTMFDNEMNLKSLQAAEDFGKYVGQRLFNGILNINDSQQVNPFYILNRSRKLSIQKILDICKFRLPTDAAEAAMQLLDTRVSGHLTVQRYHELLLTQHRILGLGLPDMRLSLPTEHEGAIKDALLEVKKGEKVKVSDYEDVNLMAVPLIWGDPADYYKKLTMSQEKKYDVAIFPGVFSPFHYGYLSSILAAMKDFNLNGVVVMPGATTGRKFEVAFKHRLNMSVIGTSKYPFIQVSPLRQEYAKMLQDVPLGGANHEHEQRLRDLGAFSFAMSMNPHCGFHYLAGVEKINDFGPSRKNEQELLLEFLLKNKIPLIWQPKKNMKFELFAREWENQFAMHGKKVFGEATADLSWLLNHEDAFQGIMREGTTPTIEMNTSEKRKKVANRYPLFDYMDPMVINYVYRERINEAYELSSQYENLVSEVKSAIRMKVNLDDLKVRLQKKLDEINAKKSQLAQEGILDNGDPLDFASLIRDAGSTL